MLAYFKLSALPLEAHAFFRILHHIMWLTAGSYGGPTPATLPNLFSIQWGGDNFTYSAKKMGT
jgi:hypothetical protein